MGLKCTHERFCISPSFIGDNPETVIGHFQDDTV